MNADTSVAVASVVRRPRTELIRLSLLYIDSGTDMVADMGTLGKMADKLDTIIRHTCTHTNTK